MTLKVGRRRLIVTLVGAPARRKPFDRPMAENASDLELARLSGLDLAAHDRRRWKMTAALYGGPRPR